MPRPIHIAGGGLAGLTLGLLLRERGVPVEIRDASGYPRQRVCGEFLSGRGVELLRRVTVLPESSENTRAANHASFFSDGLEPVRFALPAAAISISRWDLDALLAREFIARGGCLRERSRWTESFEREGLVRATGRVLKREGGWVGLKIHARNVPLESDLEVHFSGRGYLGISRLPGGNVNICALSRNRKAPPRGSDFGELFTSFLSPSRKDTLAVAEFQTESFCSVAGIHFGRERSRTAAECRLGDSICMIAPLTGNGMSLALESAFISAPTFCEYSRGAITWDEARARVSHDCEKRFGSRFRVAAFLQWLAFTASGRKGMVSILRTFPAFIKPLFYATR